MATKYILLSFPLASFGLGVWQIQRREWKLNMIDMLNERLTAEPISLMDIKSVSDLENLEYRRMKVRGRFDFGDGVSDAPQIYLKPRNLFVNDEALARGRTAHQSVNGKNVVTPFLVEGTNLRILINRGWLPPKERDCGESLKKAHNTKDSPTVDVVGIIRTSDKKSKFGMKNQMNTDEWPVRDIQLMSKTLKTAPIYLEATESLTKGEGPIGGQTQVTVRNEHLNYIITWFGLGVCTLIMWYSRYGRNSRYWRLK